MWRARRYNEETTTITINRVPLPSNLRSSTQELGSNPDSSGPPSSLEPPTSPILPRHWKLMKDSFNITQWQDWPIRDMDVGLDLLNCGLCGERLCLVAQFNERNLRELPRHVNCDWKITSSKVYAPVSTPKLNIEERVIYIFGCRMPKCGSNPRSWHAIRVQKCHHEMEIGGTKKEALPLEEDSASISKSNNWHGEDLLSFGENDEDSDDDIDLEELRHAFSEAGAQASQSRKQNVSTHSKDARNANVSKPRSIDADTNKPVVPCFYIYSQKVQSPSAVTAVCASYSSLSIKGIENPPKDNDEDEKWEAENYEHDRALSADRTYLKFKKQLDSCPEQCFRYSYGGKPLLITTDVVEPDTCRLCGSSRQYEMQLMSPLLYFLHEAGDGPSTYIPEEWSWMTLVLYTCSSSCCPSSCKQKSSSCSWAVVEEAIIVQDE